MSLPSLTIGVVTISTAQADSIIDLLACVDLTPTLTVILDQGTVPADALVDIWLANLDGVDDSVDAKLIDFPADDAPVMYCDDAQFVTEQQANALDLDEQSLKEQHAKRMVSKLRAMLPDVELNTSDVKARSRAEKLWILAASTGGPDAVARFLKGLPPHLEGVALLYAQHTDPRSIDTLRAIVRRHCGWRVEVVDAAHVVRESTIYIASPSYQIDMLDNGVLSPVDEAWLGFYKPSVNQLIAKLARTYKAQGGAIVFTGMGDDGAASCQLLHHRGGQIWVQNNESCTIDAMPSAVNDTGCASFVGDPEALSKAFVRYHLEKTLDADGEQSSKIARL